MTVLVEAERPHVCNPGYERRRRGPDYPGGVAIGWYLHQLDLAPGSVVRCDECGQVWVAEAMLPGESPGLVAYRIKWRKPTWRERRKLNL